MQLDEAKATDLSVTDEDVAQAEREAAEAGELLAELERRAVEDPDPPGPVEVIAQAELGRFARLRADHTRKRADRAKAAARLLALADLAAEIDQLAAETAKPDDVLGQAARKVTLACETFRALLSQHDARVQALAGRAAELGAEDAAPAGPRATSAFVSLLKGNFGRPSGVAHGRRQVLILGPDRAKDAVSKAAAGDTDGAVGLVRAFREQPEFHVPRRLYRSISGHVIAEDSPEESAAFAQQVAKGELVPLSKAETARWAEGKLDDTREH